MTVWLGKTHPEMLSIDEIEKKQVVMWKKVRHPKAMQFMKEMKPGEKMLVYHSSEKKIVGLIKVKSNNPDPDHPRGRLVEVEFVKRYTEPLVTLADVKKSNKFNDFRLVWEPRLSLMDVPEKFLGYFKITT